MRGVTQDVVSGNVLDDISTRTPHAGSDYEAARLLGGVLISTRTPHAGSDTSLSSHRRYSSISTRTPHAGSDRLQRPRRGHSVISTRTPHAGSDSASSYHAMPICPFQPALPMRGVTELSSRDSVIKLFQPALPMRGVTVTASFAISTSRNFNPHSPCGE